MWESMAVDLQVISLSNVLSIQFSFNIFHAGSSKIRNITFTLNSSQNEAIPLFTLTCISTGGPATNVTWTRDSDILTESTSTILNNAVEASYTHTLTVTRRVGGLYSCTVTNKKSSSSANITVQGK